MSIGTLLAILFGMILGVLLVVVVVFYFVYYRKRKKVSNSTVQESTQSERTGVTKIDLRQAEQDTESFADTPEEITQMLVGRERLICEKCGGTMKPEYLFPDNHWFVRSYNCTNYTCGHIVYCQLPNRIM